MIFSEKAIFVLQILYHFVYITLNLQKIKKFVLNINLNFTCSFFSEIVFFCDTYVNLLVKKNYLFGEIPLSTVNSVFIFTVVFTMTAENSGPLCTMLHQNVWLRFHCVPLTLLTLLSTKHVNIYTLIAVSWITLYCNISNVTVTYWNISNVTSPCCKILWKMERKKIPIIKGNIIFLARYYENLDFKNFATSKNFDPQFI